MATMSGSRDPRAVGPKGWRNNGEEIVQPDYGTYYVGQMVMFGDDDGKFKVASASVDCRGAGPSLEEKTVSASDPTLKIGTGIYVFEYKSDSAPTSKSRGQLCYIHNDLTISMTSSYRNSNVAGRIDGLTGDGKVRVLFDLTGIPSGSTV